LSTPHCSRRSRSRSSCFPRRANNSRTRWRRLLPAKAVAVLRDFALVDRDAIVDEGNASITTAAIRLHRLVREVAVRRREGEAEDRLRHALAAIYPQDSYRSAALWSRCALLTPHLLVFRKTLDTNRKSRQARRLRGLICRVSSCNLLEIARTRNTKPATRAGRCPGKTGENSASGDSDFPPKI
jgi:hypothetical protein